MPNFELSYLAASDIAGIIAYTIEKWDIDQAIRYVSHPPLAAAERAAPGRALRAVGRILPGIGLKSWTTFSASLHLHSGTIIAPCSRPPQP